MLGRSAGAPELQARLAVAVDDLVRQCAARTAALAVGSDLTALAAVKQQVRTDTCRDWRSASYTGLLHMHRMSLPLPRQTCQAPMLSA